MMKVTKKYREIALYIIFGVATTLMNILTYYVCNHWFGLGVVIATAVAWIGSVMFAYITNKLWVFKSKERKWNVIVHEMIVFFLARLATGVLDIIMMYFLVQVLLLNDMLMKILINIIIIILNYMASKLLVFKRKV